MPRGKHRITKERATQLIEGLQVQKKVVKSNLKDLPEGFRFDVEAVRQLINHPDAAHFIIFLGWKEKGANNKKGEIAPVLCVSDSNFNILENGAGQVPPGSAASMASPENAEVMMAGSLDPGAGDPNSDGGGGGYLDEGAKHP